MTVALSRMQVLHTERPFGADGSRLVEAAGVYWTFDKDGRSTGYHLKHQADGTPRGKEHVEG